MAHLFSPYTLRELTFKNRIAMSPMCQYSAIDGLANDWHTVHYATRAIGGASLILMEATAVTAQGRITPGCLGIWSDQHLSTLIPVVDQIHKNGAIAGIQLAHAGRKASCDVPWRGGAPLSKANGAWETIAPSALAFSDKHTAPAALTTTEIEEIADAFSQATVRALKAGFQVVEVHCAHGYLLHEFLSPLSNQRSDEYGGSFENRCRLPLKIAKIVRDLWPAPWPVLVRISATDWVEGGWDVAQSIKFSKLLKAMGIDLIDCSSGGLIPDAIIPSAAGFQVPFSEKIKLESGIATGAVGLINESIQANAIIETQQADLVLLGRTLLRYPYWPMLAAKELILIRRGQINTQERNTRIRKLK